MAFDAIIIGSGFGATVAALQLVAKGKRVLILERGTWWLTSDHLGKPPHPEQKKLRKWLEEQKQPHQFWPSPDHKLGLIDFYASVRGDNNTDGLYQYSTFKDAHVLTASGVGGGSLIYSGVNLMPAQEVRDSIGLKLSDADLEASRKWMESNRGTLRKIVTKIPLPTWDVDNLDEKNDYLYLDRTRELKRAASLVGQKLGVPTPWEPLLLSVLEFDQRDASPVSKEMDANHTFCERQGRCILGCVPGARHTLNKTLFSRLLREDHGVTLKPLAEVRHIKFSHGFYHVQFIDHADGHQKAIAAPTVFLGAGTLGTPEILLRSQEIGFLNLGPALGTRFSTNGDFGAFVYNTKRPVHSARGPINTSHVKIKLDNMHLTVEDAGIPEMFAAVTSTALSVLNNAVQREHFRQAMTASWESRSLPDFKDLFPTVPNTYDANSYQTEGEMVSNIFFFNVMGQDEASGRFTLRNDKLELSWAVPPADQPVYSKIELILKAFADAMEGTYIPFPLWHGLAKRKLVTTHPLGGCPIGTDNQNGVVNEFGQVFDGSKPAGSTDVLPGLHIVDGSVIPGALAVNPTITIVAQAIKTVTRALP